VPLYEYRCKSCGHTFEKIQSFSAPEEKECPACHGEVERLISAPAIQFKGSGWYVSDYANKGKSGSMKASAEGGSKGSEGSAGESKTAETPDAKTDGGTSSSSTPNSSSKGE